MSLDALASTVVNANNAFISFLDHLPCDIVRSLWLTQSLSLKNDGLRTQLDALLKSQKPGKIKKTDVLRQIATLKRQLVRNSAELIAQARYLSHILANHHSRVLNEIQLMDLLKCSRNPPDTRTWSKFTEFKKRFVFSAQDDSDHEDEDPLAQRKPTIPIKIKKLVPVEKVEQREQTQPAQPAHKKRKRRIVESDTEGSPTPADPTPPEEVYCFCRGPSMGKMIACDNSSCPIEWFHYKCVGLYTEPTTSRWFCSPDCEQKYKVRAARKRRRRKGY
ncbi:hypothetical protein OGAPHI_005214 [Ogataea philodendri]|uniref:Zinc finger PHD-type domain-containing protein n=1 Tax=Ogataea philodendri TaxID=1378263 RepID=A0A9P8T2M1_9ASCO|nr:uncharacterized protein OGAPHI_005214 [Ogataea philodendri]KAH3663811.1 hypothetical protein OGAPHI_005214 [Ogataea philodendri]